MSSRRADRLAQLLPDYRVTYGALPPSGWVITIASDGRYGPRARREIQEAVSALPYSHVMPSAARFAVVFELERAAPARYRGYRGTSVRELASFYTTPLPLALTAAEAYRRRGGLQYTGFKVNIVVPPRGSVAVGTYVRERGAPKVKRQKKVKARKGLIGRK